MEHWVIIATGFAALFLLCCLVAMVDEHIKQAKMDKERRLQNAKNTTTRG